MMVMSNWKEQEKNKPASGSQPGTLRILAYFFSPYSSSVRVEAAVQPLAHWRQLCRLPKGYKAAMRGPGWHTSATRRLRPRRWVTKIT